MQKRLFDIGWSDESKCQACHKKEGSEKHRLYHCPEWHEVRRGIPDAFRKWEQKARTSKEWKCKEVLLRIHSVKANGTGPLQYEKVGVREAQRFQGPRCNRRLSPCYGWEVGSMWLVSGAIGL